MEKLRSLCIYCGSSNNVSPAHQDAAKRFGTMLGEQKIRLVFGGGQVGLMGIAADAALAAGGEVIGIIPYHLHDVEVGHKGVTELIVTGSMHERKQKMFELSDAFVVLPGGLGTMDETFEILTWKQLKLHDKPVILVDNDGYWTPFLDLVDHIVGNGFAGDHVKKFFTTVPTVDDVLPAIKAAPAATITSEPDLL